MKAEELRIGNLIEINEVITNVDSIGFGKVGAICSMSVIRIEDIQPIPLTEEWLKKFGFEKKHTDFNKSKMPFTIKISEPQFSNFPFELWFTGNGVQIGCNCGIKYVHQLQNLYFTLTGEELILNS